MQKCCVFNAVLHAIKHIPSDMYLFRKDNGMCRCEPAILQHWVEELSSNREISSDDCVGYDGCAGMNEVTEEV